MRLPCAKIIRTVDSDAASFLLLFSLVLAKPEEFTSDMVPRYTSSMCIDDIAIGIPPSASGDNPLGRGQRSKSDASNECYCGHHRHRMFCCNSTKRHQPLI